MAIPLPLPMQRALALAQTSADAGEVPVGAVIMKDGVEIAAAANAMRASADPTAHAEMLALTAAQQSLGDWRLDGCTLYVTKEPCPMCAGAIVHCRLARVVFGAPDAKGGAAGGAMNLLQFPTLNHRSAITPGVREEECRHILKRFFLEQRNRKDRPANSSDS